MGEHLAFLELLKLAFRTNRYLGEVAEEAAALCHKHCGVGAGEGGAEEDWTLVPDNKMISILDEDGNGIRWKKTAREWADEEPKGFLCGSENT